MQVGDCSHFCDSGVFGSGHPLLQQKLLSACIPHFGSEGPLAGAFSLSRTAGAMFCDWELTARSRRSRHGRHGAEKPTSASFESVPFSEQLLNVGLVPLWAECLQSCIRLRNSAASFNKDVICSSIRAFPSSQKPLWAVGLPRLHVRLL